MWAGRPRVGYGAVHMNRCRNDEIIRGAPVLAMEPCMIEIDRFVIRVVPYQFEANRCRNEEIIVKCNFGWAWAMCAGRPRDGNGAMHNVQYKFEVNRCRNEEVNLLTQFQGSSAYSVGGDSGQDGRTDGRKTEITTISPLFSEEQ
ncbi:hypothetical protein DPMN_118221 [Dreissena polymorpha]|uniref:Uncharacterized protein n=1 Tax=Dreissena polymorpha TaxID=45954 RepID=A0A9D4GGI1_DREPO|nr:hypothetical protein DPMN_118221 [Dreissena polymorpha]